MITNSNQNTLYGYNDILILSRFAWCKGKKYQEKDWLKGKKYDYCQKAINEGKADGFGLITGEIDGLGILALDFDGHSAKDIVKSIAESLLEDNTLSWTSNKDGHFQRAFIIPKPHLPFWSGVQKHDIPSANGDHLEIRYNDHASVLPPSAHPETSGYSWLNDDGIRYLTFDESYALLDRCTAPVTSDLTSDDEQRLIQEALSFIPADDYHTWVTVGMALYRHGCDFTVWDNWSLASAKYDGKGMDKKWSSFGKANRVNIGTLFHLASANGFDQKRWMRENLKRQRQALNHTIKNDPIERKSLDTNEIIAKSNKFFEEKSKILREDERLKETTDFCNQYNLPFNSIWKTLEAKVKRLNEEYDNEDLNSYLDDLLNIPKKKLNLEEILGEFMACVINDIASVVGGGHPDVLFFCMLAELSAVIGIKQKVNVTGFSSRFKVSPILRFGLVAESGSGKSPSIDIGLSGIDDLNLQLTKEYNQALKDYKQALLDDPEGDYEPPIEKFITLDDFTFEGLYKVLEHSPSLLVRRDEMSGYFAMINNHKSGTGGNIQRDLELISGRPIRKLRATKELNASIDEHCVSFIGGLQWEVLEDIVSAKSDLTGTSARWLYFAPELPEYKLLRNKDKKGSVELWEEIQKTIVECHYYNNPPLPPELTLDDDAEDVLEYWFNVASRDARINSSLPQEKSKRIKIVGDCLKIAMLLHNFYKIYYPERVIEEDKISGVTMEYATKICDYLLAHFVYVMTKAQRTLVKGVQLRILEKIREVGKDGITIHRLQGKLGGGNKNALSTEEIKKEVMSLKDAGLVTLIQKSRGLRVFAKD